MPNTTPEKYDWLGANQRSTELPSGIIAMGARSYIPQLGRLLQPDPIEGGSADSYAYTHANPINETYLTGQATEGTPPEWAIQAGIDSENEAIQIRAAEETAAREEAERKAAEAQAAYWAYWNNYTTTQMAIFNAEMAETEENPENNFDGGDSLHFITDTGAIPLSGYCEDSAEFRRKNKAACDAHKAGGSIWEPVEFLCDLGSFTPLAPQPRPVPRR